MFINEDHPSGGLSAGSYSLEKRSLSVVPEHFTNSGCVLHHMISCDVMLLDDKKVDHMMCCRNVLKLVSAHTGQTALHEAVKVGIIIYCSSHDNQQVSNIQAVKLLLQHDTSCADIQDHHGDTPLHLACKQHKVNHKIIQELMVGVSTL